jgi:hypothetical protein
MPVSNLKISIINRNSTYTQNFKDSIILITDEKGESEYTKFRKGDTYLLTI